MKDEALALDALGSAGVEMAEMVKAAGGGSPVVPMGPSVLPSDLFDAYFASIEVAGLQACRDWSDRSAWSVHARRALYAARAVIICAHPILRGRDPNIYVPMHLAVGTVNEWGRSGGHFGLEATLTDPGNVWSAPLFIAYHENVPSPDRVQYAAWKLHSVKATQRMMVAYFGRSAPIDTFERLEGLVREVCSAHAGQDILLIGGDLEAKVSVAADLRSAHRTAIVVAPWPPQLPENCHTNR